MKNRVVIISAIVSIFTVSCQNMDKDNSIKSFHINPTNKKSASIEDISDDYYYLKLNMPDSILFGDISRIKTYGNTSFILDEEHTNTITVIDNKGRYICQLNKRGKGPGEYIKIGAFTYNIWEKSLIIYDRYTFNITKYKFPELSLMTTQKIDRYLMDIEAIGKNTIIAMSDNDDFKRGLSFWNNNIVLVKDQLLNNSSVASEFIDCAISNYNNQYYFTHPLSGVVYKIGTKSKGFYMYPIFKIDFGKYSIPDKLWQTTDNFSSAKANKFKDKIIKNKFCIASKSCITDSLFSSYFLQFNNKNPDILWHLAVINRITKKSFVFEDIHIGNEKNNITISLPVGFNNGYYISVIYPDLVSSTLDKLKNSDLKSVKEFLSICKMSAEGSPILLFFKINKL